MEMRKFHSFNWKMQLFHLIILTGFASTQIAAFSYLLKWRLIIYRTNLSVFWNFELYLTLKLL